MISYHSIENLNRQVFNLVTAAEGFRSYVYHDPLGIPTLGYGFALVVKDGDEWKVRSRLQEHFLNGIVTLNGDQKSLLNQAIAALNRNDQTAVKALFL